MGIYLTVDQENEKRPWFVLYYDYSAARQKFIIDIILSSCLTPVKC